MLVEFTVAIAMLTASMQVFTAQSSGKAETEENPVTFSAFLSDEGTKNAEAEKLRNGGIEFTIKKEYNLAIAAFTKAIKLDPKYADAYSRRGVA